MPTAISGTPIDTDSTLAANSDSLVASQKASKAYIDATIANFDIKDPVLAATTSALPFSPSYSNGSSGVGATLTGAVGILAFDGYTPVLGDRLLIKNESSTLTQGVYTLTTVGTALIGYVLTRATDFNQTSNIVYGDTVAVLQGTANANQQFTMNNQTAITVGTTAITFAQTSGGSQLSSGTGITITGNSVAINTAVTVDKTTAQTLSSKTLTSPIISALGNSATNLSVNSNKLTDITDPTSPQDGASKNYVDAQIAAISNQGSGFTGVITGCGVVWTSLLNFTVAAGTYAINGTSYSITQTDLTLSAADPTNPRFDVIAVNTSSAAVVIAGTPAASPLIPTVDPATQLYLTAISIPANATTPGNITSTSLYAENAGSPTEWTSSSSGTTWSLASTNNPHAGTKDIEATSLTAAAYVQLQKPSSTIDLSTQNSLVFYIRSKATWNSNRSLTIEFLNAGVLVGNPVTFREGSGGFVSSNTTSYQQILVNISSFNVGNTAVNQIRFIAAGSGGSAIGFYLDDISLQAGVTTGTQNAMAWKGPWSSSTAYVKNDTTISGSRAWVALLPSTNSQPSDTNTNWQAIEDFSGVKTTYTSSFTVAATTCWPATGFVTLSGNIYATIPSGSNLFVMGGSGTLGAVNTYPDAHAFGGLLQTTSQVATNFVSSSATAVDVTGLSFAAAANTFYEVEATLLASLSSGSASINVTYTGTLGGGNGNGIYLVQTLSAPGAYLGGFGVVGASPTNLTNIWNASESTTKVFSAFRTLTAGTIKIQIVPGGGTATVVKGSRMTVTTLRFPAGLV